MTAALLVLPAADRMEKLYHTLGSRVPEWPVFSTRRILLIHATTSCDEGLEGLSRLITP